MTKIIMIPILMALTLIIIPNIYAQTEMNVIGLSTQLHKLELGEPENGVIGISWDSPNQLTVTRVSAGEFSDWFGFKLTPIDLDGSDIISTGKIPYVIRAPEIFCDVEEDITLNCAELNYDIEILVEGILDGSPFSTTTIIQVEMNIASQEIMMITIGLAIVVGLFYVWSRSKKVKRKVTGKQKQMARKKGTFESNLNNLKS